MTSTSATGAAVGTSARVRRAEALACDFAAILTLIMVGYLRDTEGVFVIPLCVIGGIALSRAVGYLLSAAKTEPLPVPAATVGN